LCPDARLWPPSDLHASSPLPSAVRLRTICLASCATFLESFGRTRFVLFLFLYPHPPLLLLTVRNGCLFFLGHALAPQLDHVHSPFLFSLWLPVGPFPLFFLGVLGPSSFLTPLTASHDASVLEFPSPLVRSPFFCTSRYAFFPIVGPHSPPYFFLFGSQGTPKLLRAFHVFWVKRFFFGFASGWPVSGTFPCRLPFSFLCTPGTSGWTWEGSLLPFQIGVADVSVNT